MKRKPVSLCTTIRWVYHFMSSNHIVVKGQTAKITVSPEKQLFIEKSIAYHSRVLKRKFRRGIFDKDLIENAAETQFFINIEDGKTIGFIEDSHLNYADVFSAGKAMTMIMQIPEGSAAAFQTCVLILMFPSRLYSLRGVPDTVSGVCYRSLQKAWMDPTFWNAWLNERLAVGSLPDGECRVLYFNNCSSHVTTPEVFASFSKKKPNLRKFPGNAADMIQQVDAVLIQKMKGSWSCRWNRYKMDCVKERFWREGGNGEESGRLRNPGKKFFPNLAADSVREVSNVGDACGMSYARKAMIHTGMS